MRRLRPSIKVIQAKVIHCRRSTETLLARGAIRSLKRCHCTITHCISAERQALTILTTPMHMGLLQTHATNRLKRRLPAQRPALMAVDIGINALKSLALDKKRGKL